MTVGEPRTTGREAPPRGQRSAPRARLRTRTGRTLGLAAAAAAWTAAYVLNGPA